MAVIGYGTIARDAHLPYYTKNPKSRIKYVVDIEPSAISICTPNNTHAPIAIDFLNAGKNVL